MAKLSARDWVPEGLEQGIVELADWYAAQSIERLDEELAALVARNREIHERDCVNLNPATNVMNPRAERLLGAGLGTRPSLGYPGDKYEMGLEAMERIEVMAAELAAEVFGARFAEIRVPSGAIANLYAYMATTSAGDTVFAPPAAVGGHVTHHAPGAAGLFGVRTHAMRVDAARYTVDLDALREDALRLHPKVITIGGSLNLCAHPVREVRAVADEVGAVVLYDAAHVCGVIAGRQWQQPLEEGAHLMTMSTYKSLGGPPGGLVLTNEPGLAQRLDAIAFPGLTANFDAGKTAALALTLLDWKAHGARYAAAMCENARTLAAALAERGVALFTTAEGPTRSHQFAVEAAPYGGGQRASKLLRQANVLACGIGLPSAPVEGDVNGIRMGTPEVTRWGMGPEEMVRVAGFVADALSGRRAPERIAAEVAEFRKRFDRVVFVR